MVQGVEQNDFGADEMVRRRFDSVDVRIIRVRHVCPYVCFRQVSITKSETMAAGIFIYRAECPRQTFVDPGHGGRRLSDVIFFEIGGHD